MSIHAVRTKLANRERMCTSNSESGESRLNDQPDCLVPSTLLERVPALASWIASEVGIQRIASTADSENGIATLYQRL